MSVPLCFLAYWIQVVVEVGAVWRACISVVFDLGITLEEFRVVRPAKDDVRPSRRGSRQDDSEQGLRHVRVEGGDLNPYFEVEELSQIRVPID
jgi:hypothetical protein